MLSDAGDMTKNGQRKSPRRRISAVAKRPVYPESDSLTCFLLIQSFARSFIFPLNVDGY